MMKRKKVSNAELMVLELLWKAEDALSVAQVVALMEEENDVKWAYTTGGTVLRRMDQKGYVHSEKRGASFFYTAILQENDLQQKTGLEKASSVIENYFQGSFSKFLAAFARNGNLTRKEFEDLKEWVEKHADDY